MNFSVVVENYNSIISHLTQQNFYLPIKTNYNEKDNYVIDVIIPAYNLRLCAGEEVQNV
jgi:hypothetical protein